MFGSIGMPELVIILVIALIIFGPRKLPELGKSLGKSINEFKKASTELQNTLEKEIQIEEQKVDVVFGSEAGQDLIECAGPVDGRADVAHRHDLPQRIAEQRVIVSDQKPVGSFSWQFGVPPHRGPLCPARL